MLRTLKAILLAPVVYLGATGFYIWTGWRHALILATVAFLLGVWAG